MKTLFILATLAAAALAQAASPADVLEQYRREAAASAPGFVPAAARGQEFFSRRFDNTASMPSCATCHTDNPLQAGKHSVTGKAIKPLAPAANAERFTELAKVEKWFGRNCKEVLGRPCSAAEKADFVQFALTVR